LAYQSHKRYSTGTLVVCFAITQAEYKAEFVMHLLGGSIAKFRRGRRR